LSDSLLGSSALRDRAGVLAGELRAKIENRTATVGVLGLGYVGVPLIMAFASQGFKTIGFDPNPRLVEGLQGGRSHIEDIAAEEISAAREGDRFRATSDFSLLAECDVAIICVPTPLNATRDPDLKYVEAASKSAAKYLRAGQMVILESTTYPGTTDEIVRPILEGGGLKAGRDFFLAFSPERIDPGNVDFPVHKVPKVVGGHDARSSELAVLLYSTVVAQPVPVSSTQAAELTKLLENIFRCVNIALVNEMTMLCDRMGIDIWEVIDAAATKPYGFTKFLPGPGLGGHCIPIDPFYLSWKAKEFGFQTSFIELAGEVNSAMPKFVIEKITRALNDDSKAVRGAKIGLLGMSYKANVGDVRESPSLRVAELLHDLGADLMFHDPHVESVHLFHGTPRAFAIRGHALDEILACDCVVLLTNHRAYNYDEIARSQLSSSTPATRSRTSRMQRRASSSCNAVQQLSNARKYFLCLWALLLANRSGHGALKYLKYLKYLRAPRFQNSLKQPRTPRAKPRLWRGKKLETQRLVAFGCA
jgi:UDP-N-acetyl-D-glucosamine dehydrogenase